MTKELIERLRGHPKDANGNTDIVECLLRMNEAADALEGGVTVTDEMVEAAFNVFKGKMLMYEEDRDIITRMLQAALLHLSFPGLEAGEPTSLAACPVGLFMAGDELCLKTEYGNDEGRIDAYIVSSGEFFWGEHPQTVHSQREQRVRPVTLAARSAISAPAQRVEEGWKQVPFDATDAMIEAARAVDMANENEDGALHNVWHVMLAASPAPAPHAGVDARLEEILADESPLTDEDRQMLKDFEHVFASPEVVHALFTLDRDWKHPTKGVEALRKLVELKEGGSIAGDAAKFVDELALAVDEGAADIGGHRNQRTIFEDLRAALENRTWAARRSRSR